MQVRGHSGAPAWRGGAWITCGSGYRTTELGLPLSGPGGGRVGQVHVGAHRW